MTSPDASDEVLLERVRRHDGRALGELFARHRDFVFRVAYGAGGDRDLAVEVVQEVFLALLRQASQVDARQGQLTSWLYRVAANKVRDHVRRKYVAGRVASGQDREMSVHATQEGAVLAGERRRRLASAVAALPPRPREVFVLRVGLGFSVERTAEWTGIGAAAVRTALHTAKRLLGDALAERRRPTSTRRK